MLLSIVIFVIVGSSRSPADKARLGRQANQVCLGRRVR